MRPERRSSASATVVKANGRNQGWLKPPVRRLPYTELDNLHTYVPLRIAVRNARRFGDLNWRRRTHGHVVWRPAGSAGWLLNSLPAGLGAYPEVLRVTRVS